MNLNEYNKVKKYSYEEYCKYLQDKYGLAKGAYYSPSWVKNQKITRTKEGLVIHHKMEDHAIMLSNQMFAQMNPYEWQLPENLVFCDYLEHLLLHIMICEEPSSDKNDFEVVGYGGVVNFIVPELNDLYSGWKTNQVWRMNCHNRVINDKDVYLTLIKRFKNIYEDNPLYKEDCLYTSFNEEYGGWSRKQNAKLFQEIKEL